jgi:poly(A) polymerase
MTISLLEKATDIVRTLKNKGYQAVFAGGSVRDRLLAIPFKDIDIATDAPPDAVETLFEHTLAVGKSFGVIVVVVGDDQFEVATFRTDGVYGDGRRPDSVTFSSMEEDARRRDLTINGMFWDPIEEKLYDYVGGRDDLEEGIVRLIGNPQDRIKEDKLRLMRVIRFAVRFNFKIDPETFCAVEQHASEIQFISVERIFDELLKILRLGRFAQSIELLMKTRLLNFILPEVKAMQGVEQPVDYHPEGDVLTHTIIAMGHLPKNASDELLVATLLHDVGKPKTQTFEDRIRFNAHDAVGARMAEDILKRFKAPNDFIEHVVLLVRSHMKFMCVRDMKKSTLKRFVRVDKFSDYLALHYSDCMSSHGSLEHYEFVKEFMERAEPDEIRPVKLITGNDLKAVGIPTGPIYRTIILEVEDEQLEGRLRTREDALEYVRKFL